MAVLEANEHSHTSSIKFWLTQTNLLEFSPQCCSFLTVHSFFSSMESWR